MNKIASTTTRGKNIYETLSNKLATFNVMKTPQQVKNKIKNLKSEYKKEKDHLNRSGRDRKPTGKYFDVMDEILGSRPAIAPQGRVKENMASTGVDSDPEPDEAEPAVAAAGAGDQRDALLRSEPAATMEEVPETPMDTDTYEEFVFFVVGRLLIWLSTLISVLNRIINKEKASESAVFFRKSKLNFTSISNR